MVFSAPCGRRPLEVPSTYLGWPEFLGSLCWSVREAELLDFLHTHTYTYDLYTII